MTFPRDWAETPGSKPYAQPTYTRRDGMVVRYDMNSLEWVACFASGEDARAGTALHPRAVIDVVDQLFPLEVEQRIVHIAVTPHGALLALSDVGRLYKFDTHSETWELLQLPPLPIVR